jgi:hypothetical protein
MAIEKIKILGSVLEIPAKQHANLAHLAHFRGEWAGLAVLSSWYLQNGSQDSTFFNYQGCQLLV